jgi:selenocysteine lyase/cysteine desulfurase
MKYDPPIDASAVRPHYKRTLHPDRILLTAHSHRAWPDRIASGQIDALDLAFEWADQKWSRVFGEVIPEFQRMVAARIGTDRPELIANGENCHELVTRLLSCFPWDERTRVVTTDSEFHSTKRQLYRLEEEGVKVDYVSAIKKERLTERLCEAITAATDIAIVSSVFFTDGFILQDAAAIAEKARKTGTTLVFDAYHQFNVRQMDTDAIGRDVFVTAAGYKYAGCGEGAAWMKIPENCSLRPRITGWFADFASLEKERYPRPVEYGPDGQRFLGATRDLSGICRQIEVFRFMDELDWTVDRLERNNLHQTAYMIHLYDDLGLEDHGARLLSSRNDGERGPFLALDVGSTEAARKTYHELLERHQVWTDTRGSIVRFGPAPYTTGDELVRGMESLRDVLSGMAN